MKQRTHLVACGDCCQVFRVNQGVEGLFLYFFWAIANDVSPADLKIDETKVIAYDFAL
jgi:hypothetical protein